MIKKYNQFVKDINEEFEMGQEQPSPVTKPAEPTTVPDTPTRPRPTRPGITPTEIPSEDDAPLAYHHGEEEEEGNDVYTANLQKLASMLGTEVEDNSINYEGHKIIFPSETEMYHIVGDKNKFKTAQEVIDYLESSTSSKMTPEEENEMTGEIEGERNIGLDDIDEDEFEKGDDAFESKSYRVSRLKKFGK
jgi:hypothetical protein